MDSFEKASVSSDGSFDMINGGNDNGLSYVSTGRKKDKKKSKKGDKRRSSRMDGSGMGGSSRLGAHSPVRTTTPGSTRTSSNDFEYGSQYILPPKPEEQVSLVSSDNLDPSDPLAAAGGGAQIDPPTLENFQDEFEDEMDEIEMDKRQNFSGFSSRSQPKQRRARRGCSNYAIPILIGILFLLGIIAAVLYLAGVGSSKSSGNKDQQSVPAALETLSLMCHSASPVTAETPVPTLCRDNCMEAECCWNPGGDKECTNESKRNCPTYQVECNPYKSQLLGGDHLNDGQMNVPPLPAGLQTSCTKTLNENNLYHECKDGCAAAACCWNEYSTHICTSQSVHNCLNYNEICSFLNDHLDKDGNYISSAASTAENPTSISGSGSVGGSSGGTAGGGGTNTQKDWPWPDAPDGLSIYCDPAEMEEISLHICEDKCNQAECCWKDDIDSCVDQYAPPACHDYKASCQILNKLSTAPDNSHDVTSATPPPATAQSNDNTLPVAPADLGQTCSKDKITNNDSGGEALIKCEQECLAASCCWQPNAASPCPENPRCEDYKSCDIFANLFDKPTDYNPNAETLPPVKVSDVPQAASNIGEMCSPDVLKTSVDGGKFIVECEKVCLMGACCWKENHPTHCPDAPECGAYQTPCGSNLVNALVALEGGNTSNGAGQTQPTPPPAPAPTVPAPTAPAPTRPSKPVENNVPEAPSNIEMMCNPDVLDLKVSNGDFIVQCEKECLEAACCWKENHATVCPDAPQCGAYKVPCGDHLVPVLEQMENGRPNNQGSSSNSIPDAPDELNVLCSVSNLNSNGRGECEDACNRASCCWNNNGSPTRECAQNSKCLEYQMCENLLSSQPASSGSNGGNAPPSPPSNLGEICAATSLLDLNGLELCRVACSVADCCWLGESDPLSCTTAAECRTYQSQCELMRDMLDSASQNGGNNNGSGSSSSSSSNTAIESACDTSTDFYLRSRCEQACRPGKCCLDGTACAAGIDCSDYEPCGVLEDRRLLRLG